jgi:hypothetical protein
VILLSLVWPDRASNLLQERVSEITHSILDFSTTIFTGFLSGLVVPKTRRDRRIENTSQQSQSQTIGTRSVKQSIPDLESVPVPTKEAPKSLNEVVLAAKAKTEGVNLDFDEKSIIELQR